MLWEHKTFIFRELTPILIYLSLSVPVECDGDVDVISRVILRRPAVPFFFKVDLHHKRNAFWSMGASKRVKFFVKTTSL